MEAKEFEELLKKHDWSYHCSDDPRVFRNGEASIRKIEALAAADPELAQMLAAFRTAGTRCSQKEAA